MIAKQLKAIGFPCEGVANAYTEFFTSERLAQLAEIARKTDGEFYRATNNQKLHEVYQEIDKLEKTKMNVKQYSKRYEAYGMFMLISVLCLLLELLLQNTILKRIP